ncbi:thioredoxin-dependent thiol peroxidase [Psittacicella hinzii]|uniref:thioredoxin-dependent peroxiredoxin n=1 Tax=Psittacicella hinzii TaxID=2028575 RepID=A0A3A1YPF1_9GAMM|nr:thioredoxin-dependent thiol peroxidase [Psittacicella hinzii]RIY40163.1 thioredoxin-dependent thiol peroxidase [Psittacicella hinzii]
MTVKGLEHLLTVGQDFPAFSLEANDGKTYTNHTFKQMYLVYFYPRAMTPGCTAQACSLEQAVSTGLTLPILGVSPDTVDKQSKFAAKYNLTFPLLADTELSLAKACGVWGPKTFMGITKEGLHRIAFLVSTEGKILEVFTKIKTKEFATQVNEVLAKLDK